MSALPQSGTARPLPLRESGFDRTSGFADYTLSGFANYNLSGFDRTATAFLLDTPLEMSGLAHAAAHSMR